MGISAVPDATNYTWNLPNGWSGSSTTTSILATPESNAQSGNITVTANNGCGSSAESTLFVSVLIDFDTYAHTKWNNTFVLNINKLTEVYSDVTACKWYKYGDIIGEDFYYSAGNSTTDFLESGVNYRFEVVTNSHGTLFSTNKVISKPFSTLKVYPNPVPQGNKLTIEGTISGKPVEVYNLNGACVKSTIATDNITELLLDVQTGVYVVRSNNEEVKVIIK